MKIRSKFPWIYMAVITIIIYVPIVLTVIYSFNESRISSIWGGFSLTWYKTLFANRSMAEALKNSIVLAVLSCLAAVVIGTTGAIGMQKYKNKVNNVISNISVLPLMIPEIILGMVFLATFSFLNLPFGMLTLVIAHTTFCVPYIFMTVKARLVGIDPSIEEAARDLGANGVQIFFDITLPAIMPAILSGGLLAFAASFDDVVISIFVTGAKINTLPIKIYTSMKTGVTPEINALATMILLVTMILVVLSQMIGRYKRRNENIGGRNEKKSN